MPTDAHQPLRPAQLRVADKLKKSHGVLVYHSTGAGKTRTALNAAKYLGLPTEVIVPPTTLGQWKAEAEKMQIGPNLRIRTYDDAMKDLSPRAGLVVVDEAHNFGQPSTKRATALSQWARAQKMLLLTGTPYRNHPYEAAMLVNSIAGSRLLPADKDQFDALFFNRPTDQRELIRLFGYNAARSLPTVGQAQAQLIAALKGKVDYFDAQSEEPDMFPTVSTQSYDIPMSKPQWQMYRAAIGKLPAPMRLKLALGMKFNADEARRAVAFLTSPRQISNNPGVYSESVTDEDQPKIQAAYLSLLSKLKQDPAYRAIIYSAYKGGGINAYMQRLDRAGIPYGRITGDMSKKKRKELRDAYNEGKLRAMFITSAGSEGLDLKGARLVQLLEPHWHGERDRQVIGRAVRYGSHLGLPPDKRNVTVEKYKAVPPGSIGVLSRMLSGHTPSADQILDNLSREKEKRNAVFRDWLLQAAKEALCAQESMEKVGASMDNGRVAKRAAYLAKQAAVNLMPIKRSPAISEAAGGSMPILTKTPAESGINNTLSAPPTPPPIMDHSTTTLMPIKRSPAISEAAGGSMPIKTPAAVANLPKQGADHTFTLSISEDVAARAACLLKQACNDKTAKSTEDMWNDFVANVANGSGLTISAFRAIKDDPKASEAVMKHAAQRLYDTFDDKEAAAAWLRQLMAGKLSDGALNSIVQRAMVGAPEGRALSSGIQARLVRPKDVTELVAGIGARKDVAQAALKPSQKRNFLSMLSPALKDLRSVWH